MVCVRVASVWFLRYKTRRRVWRNRFARHEHNLLVNYFGGVPLDHASTSHVLFVVRMHYSTLPQQQLKGPTLIIWLYYLYIVSFGQISPRIMGESSQNILTVKDILICTARNLDTHWISCCKEVARD